jgi:syntaxin 5
MPLPQPASARDRTPEFLVLCERLQKQLGGTAGVASANGTPGGSRSEQIQAHSEFARKAADIGHGIHRASLKLQKLAQLAKRTSMFDDPAREVDELTGLIKHDIQALNNAIAELQRVGQRGRDADSKQSLEHSSTVVDTLRSRLKDTTLQFKDVLTVRTDNLKHHKERRQLFSSSDADAAVPLLRPPGGPGHLGGPRPSFGAGGDGPVLPTSAALGGAAASSSAAGGAGHHASPPLPSFLQQSQAQLTMEAPQEAYTSSRAEALRNVESTIAELGTIFNKLSEMVASQGELVVRIDDNVGDTLANVNDAQAQLLKYLNTISSNRWLVMKVFGVLLVFVVMFIMFVA